MGLTVSSATNHGYSSQHIIRTTAMTTYVLLYATLYSICHRPCAQRIIYICEAQYYIIGLVGVSVFLQNLSNPHDKKTHTNSCERIGENPLKIMIKWKSVYSYQLCLSRVSFDQTKTTITTATTTVALLTIEYQKWRTIEANKMKLKLKSSPRNHFLIVIIHLLL